MRDQKLVDVYSEWLGIRFHVYLVHSLTHFQDTLPIVVYGTKHTIERKNAKKLHINYMLCGLKLTC